jgi:mannose/cellobiose epimerase-like protein (N-acyl-D-glucosamine 2-epimerase family)
VSKLNRIKLVEFGKKSALESGGFGWLNSAGEINLKKNLEAWINFRMTYVFALEKIGGNETANAYLGHGLAVMRNLFNDKINGGYFAEVSTDGKINSDKKSYEFAFALLALSAASRAGDEVAKKELDVALQIFEMYFWDEKSGLVNESWDEEFKTCSNYHGLNANMHSVEAFLELYKFSKDSKWLSRANRICEFAFSEANRCTTGLIPEHFDENWVLDEGYNQDDPKDPFHPFGIIIGHQFEWARLAIELSQVIEADAPDWLVSEAENIYKIAKQAGWNSDGAPGFVYTIDFDGKPVVRMRMHWVVTEAIAAAWTLFKITGSANYLNDFEEWWSYAEKYFLDPDNGSWRHELDAANCESSSVWDGRPDVYHAYQALSLINS